MTDPIYRLWNFGLGDHWQSMCLFRHLARAGNRPTVSTMQHGTDFRRRVREIHDVLEPENGVNFTTYGSTDDLDGFDVWACPLWPTRAQWEFPTGIRPRFCYQFDGESSAREKNPPPEDQTRLMAHLNDLGYAGIRLNSNMSIADCVCALALCDFFVGCDSGMSHIAHSVRTPVYLLEYELPVITCHRGKAYTLCRGVDEFIGQSERYLNLAKKLRVGAL